MKRFYLSLFLLVACLLVLSGCFEEDVPSFGTPEVDITGGAIFGPGGTLPDGETNVVIIIRPGETGENGGHDVEISVVYPFDPDVSFVYPIEPDITASYSDMLPLPEPETTEEETEEPVVEETIVPTKISTPQNTKATYDEYDDLFNFIKKTKKNP